MTAHELVSALKELALELGRTPTRREFVKSARGADYALNRAGGFGALLKMAELVPEYIKKVDNSIFLKDPEQVIESYKPEIKHPKLPVKPTLCIPDTHFPWVNPEVLEAIYKYAEIHKPERIIQLGDLYDLYAHSKFPKSMNVYTPNQEEDLARKGAEEMWAKLRSISPQAECVQLKGNHDQRAVKRALEASPALERAVEGYINELMTFPGVTLIKDARQEYEADGILFIHGYKTGFGVHRDYMMRSVCCGHSHMGSTTFKKLRGETIFELNCGLAGLPDSKAFDYTPQKIIPWTCGFGIVDELGPRFIPI